MKPRVLRPTRAELLPALASGVLFGIAFPPFPFVLPAFVCLAPLAVAIATAADDNCGVRSAARIGFWFAIVGYGINLYWIAVALSLFTWLASLGYVGALIWLAPWLAGTGAALYVARRVTRWPLAVLLPVVWVASELVLNYLSDLSFPWLPLGLAVARRPLLAQIADVSGVRTISFWMALTNGLLADAYLLRARRVAALVRVAACVVLAACVAAYGAWRMRTTQLVPLAPVAIVQPNIPEDEKLQRDPLAQERFIGALTGATRRIAAERRPRLVLWPEAAVPDFLSRHANWSDSVRTAASVSRAPLLFGVLDLDYRSPEDYEYYNAALLVDSTGAFSTQAAYHKAFLVPVVERVPFLNPRWFSALKYFGGFGRGLAARPFDVGFGRAGMLICYESIFPQWSREYRRNGADLLVNITNDAWFGRSLAPYQHVAHLALRAIETRVGIVRAANTGISIYFDPLGRAHGETDLFVRAERAYDAETTRVRTLYVRLGDWLGVLCLSATAAWIGLFVGRRYSRPRPSTNEPDPIVIPQERA